MQHEYSIGECRHEEIRRSVKTTRRDIDVTTLTVVVREMTSEMKQSDLCFSMVPYRLKRSVHLVFFS